MGNNILIAHATTAGSTAEVAEAIALELRAAGPEVDVRPDSPSPAPSSTRPSADRAFRHRSVFSYKNPRPPARRSGD